MMAAQRKENFYRGQFDPLACTKQLEKAGFTREQAETQAEIIFLVAQEKAVNKSDLKKLEAELKHGLKVLEEGGKKECELIRRDIKELDVGFKHDLKALEEEGKKERELIRRDIKELDTKAQNERELIRREIKELELELKQGLKTLEEEGKKERELIRRDIKELEVGLKRDIKELEVGLKREIELSKRGLKIWFGGMLTIAVAALATLMTFLSHIHS